MAVKTRKVPLHTKFFLMDESPSKKPEGYYRCTRDHIVLPEDIPSGAALLCPVEIVERSSPVKAECVECRDQHPSYKKGSNGVVHIGPAGGVPGAKFCGGKIVFRTGLRRHTICNMHLQWMNEPLPKSERDTPVLGASLISWKAWLARGG